MVLEMEPLPRRGMVSQIHSSYSHNQTNNKQRNPSRKSKPPPQPMHLRVAWQGRAWRRMEEVMPGAAGHTSITMSRASCRATVILQE